MQKTLAILALLVILGAFVVLGIVRTAIVRPAYPDAVELSGLEAEVSLTWQEATTEISAASTHDAWTGLGYVHGLKRPWPLLLWREVALGQLSARFGVEFVDVDEAVRLLGLGTIAQVTYRTLSAEEQHLLEAYAEGMNAALAVPLFDGPHEMLRWLQWNAEPWQPWHTLAVERLFAWLATPPLGGYSPAQVGPDWHRLQQGDTALRELLALHGFDHSYVARMLVEEQPTLISRYVWGASVFPTQLNIHMRLNGRVAVQGTTVPGTPIWIQGVSQDHAFAYLLKSSTQVETRPLVDTLGVQYDRIGIAGADEHSVSFRRTSDALMFAAPEANASDSTAQNSALYLVWEGFRSITDLRAWVNLGEGSKPHFVLFDSVGVFLERDREWQQRQSEFTFISASPWMQSLRSVAGRLQQASTDRVLVHAWGDVESPWARSLLPPLLAALDSTSQATPTLHEAKTFLENWDYQYAEASIAASLFDAWVWQISDALVPRPVVLAPQDSGRWAGFVVPAFEQAIDSLQALFGPNMREWQWGNVQPDRRFFPLAKALAESTRRSERFFSDTQPFIRAGKGHPATLRGGGSLLQAFAPAPALQFSAFQLFEPSTFQTLHTSPAWERMFSRQLEQQKMPDPVSVAPVRADDLTTILRPIR